MFAVAVVGCGAEPARSQATSVGTTTGTTSESPPPPPLQPETTGISKGGRDTSSGSQAGSSSGSSVPETDSSSSTGGEVGSIGETDTPPPTACSVWDQDCPRGEKCTPVALDGGVVWDANRCVAVDPEPVAAGSVCTVSDHLTSGLDNCDETSLCYYADSDSLSGVCVPYCQGSLEEPSCPTDTGCAVTNGGVVSICRDLCHPLDGPCPSGQLCIPLPGTGGDLFGCAPDASGSSGAAGDPCQYSNGCDAGHLCRSADEVPGCEDDKCCTPFCDLGVAECPFEGQSCVQWWSEDAPDGFENLGLCI